MLLWVNVASWIECVDFSSYGVVTRRLYVRSLYSNTLRSIPGISWNYSSLQAQFTKIYTLSFLQNLKHSWSETTVYNLPTIKKGLPWPDECNMTSCCSMQVHTLTHTHSTHTQCSHLNAALPSYLYWERQWSVIYQCGLVVQRFDRYLQPIWFSIICMHLLSVRRNFII